MKYFLSFLFVKSLIFINVVLFCFNLIAQDELLPISQIRDIGSQKGVLEKIESLSETQQVSHNGDIIINKDIDRKNGQQDSICTPRYMGDINIDRRMNDPYSKDILKNGEKKLYSKQRVKRRKKSNNNAKDLASDKVLQDGQQDSICTPRYMGDINIDRRMNDPYSKDILKNGEKFLTSDKKTVQDRETKSGEVKIDLDKDVKSTVSDSEDLGAPGVPVDFVQKLLTKKFEFSLQGAIALEGMYDTRQVIGYKYNQYTFFPAPQKLDETGLDINDKSQFNMMGIRAFCAAIFKGPDVFDAKTSALIEGDFSGINDETVSLFRLKKAFATLSWNNTSILMGQYYHPLSLDELYPEVISAGRGIIYDPYRFSPQFRFRHRMDQFEFVLAIAKRFDSKASRTAAIPDIFGQLNLNIGDQVMGAGLNYHSEVPRLYSQVINNNVELNSTNNNSTVKLFKTTEAVNSIYPFVFAALKYEPFDIRTKLTYAENGNVYAMIGGYAVESRNEETDERIYINLRTLAWWADIIYKRLSRFEPGLFVGISKNIGASRNIIKGYEESVDESFIDPDFLTLLQIENATTGIDYTFILAPRLRLKFGELLIGAELEYSRASFARPITDPDWERDFNSKGMVVCGKPVNNFRILLATFYNFDYCPFVA